MKRTKLLRRSPIRKSRAKARPGRLKGKRLQELRELVHARQRGRCDVCGKLLPLDGDVFTRMHLAHRRNKRMWGDGEQNVRGLCFNDHWAEHNPKACPKKEREQCSGHPAES